jgi:hypothetical protein
MSGFGTTVTLATNAGSFSQTVTVSGIGASSQNAPCKRALICSVCDYARRARLSDAAKLFGAATAMLHRVGVNFEPPDQAEFDKAIELASAQFGPQRFSGLHAQGMSCDRTRALDCAHEISQG